MQDPSVLRLVNEVINPVLNLLVAFVRPLGVLAAGLVAGSVLRYTLLYRFQRRLALAVVFLGVVALFWAGAQGRWSSPASLAALGFGLLIGYMMRSNLPAEAVQPEAPEASAEGTEP